MPRKKYNEMTLTELREQAERNRIQNQDQREDAQRRMAWYSLTGMLIYPLCIVLAMIFDLPEAAEILGDMAATYFVSVAAIVAAFYAKEGYIKKNLDDIDSRR